MLAAGDTPKDTTPTSNDTPTLPDWRHSSAEEVLKGAKLWHPREDAWLRSTKSFSPSERAHHHMESYLSKCYQEELQELNNNAVSIESPVAETCDPKVLCAWLTRSLPPLPWPGPDDGWYQDPSVFSASHTPTPPFRWTPPLNPDCRHPDDHIIVAPPSMPTQGDGRCFLRSTPTFFRPRIGSSRALKTRALLDNCANLCLANRAFMERMVPSITVHDFVTGVDGIGSTKTSGYVHVPIYVDCMARIGGKVGKVELNLEIHLVDNLGVDLIVGMDAIQAYSIDTIISRSMALITVNKRELAFPIEFRRSKGMRDPASSDRFPVLCAKDTVIPPFHEAPVNVLMGYKTRGDSWLHAFHVPNDTALWHPIDGGWVAEGPLSTDTDSPRVLFANMSNRFLRLRRGTLVGHMTLCGTHDFLGVTDIRHDMSPTATPSVFSCVPKKGDSAALWASLVSSPWSRSRTPTPTTPPPASLIDPHNRDPAPITPTPTASPFDVSDAYGNNGPPECISTLLELKRAAFSFDGKPGIVKSVSISINSDDSKLCAEAPRHVGPLKRRIIDESIQQLLDWDVIEPSRSRVGYPVVLVHQHDKWRFCVDYRNLNLATVSQAYPMTRTDAVFDALHGKRVFSILDAARGYHQLPIAPTDRWKTAFITHKGLFQYKRMPFGLKNAPVQFQSFMNSVLGSLRWTAALVYIDDILVFSDDLSSHVTHLRTLLDSAISVGLKFNPDKCHFAYPSLKVLGLRVSTDGLSVLEDRAAAIKELATPRSLKELWHVLGVFGYYRQFIPKYALIAAPLTRLTKGTRFQKLPDGTWQPRDSSGSSNLEWGTEQDEAFLSLKNALSSSLVLAFPDFSLPFILYVDASHDGMAACLHQPFVSGDDLPLMASTAPPAPQPDIPIASAHPSFSFDFADDEMNTLRSHLRKDKIFSHTYKLLLDNPTAAGISDRFELLNDVLYWRLRDGRLAVCLPEALIPRILHAAHDSAGHWGFEKTWSIVKNRFYRPGLSLEVHEYVRRCPDCQRVKSSHQRRLGDMSPHEMAESSFQTVSMDIILGLPALRRGDMTLDACMVIVDQFSKAVILRPLSSTANACACADVFFDALVSRGFLPSKLITDRDPKFVSAFWSELMKRLKIDCKLISAYHQQADPAERYIQTIQTMLRLYVIDDNWAECLPFIELIMNNTTNASTGHSPNQLMFIDPPNPIPVITQPPNAQIPAVADRLTLAHARVEQARDNLERASTLQKRQYDIRHRQRPLRPGDKVFVLLNLHPIRSLVQGMHKLKDNKWGPFTILEMVGNQAARLDLPPSSRVHPVFSTLHLQPFIEDTFGRVCKPPPAAVIDGDDAWEVEYIFGERTRNGKTEFKVKWVGYPDTEFTWEPEANLRHDMGSTADLMIRNFRRKRNAALAVAMTLSPSLPPDRPIYFISRVLKSYEENYMILELEMAAMVWAILKFQRYLDGSFFTVVTDHQSLLAVTGSSSNTIYSSRVDKWRMLLAPYLGQMRLVHRAGRIHGNADGLSRARRTADGG